MDWIVIHGVPPYDGRYELDLEQELTTREWGWIKRLAGYLPLDLDREATFGDPEFACVLAVIAMRRAGRIQPSEVTGVFDRIADAPFGSAITVQAGAPEQEEEPDVDPTASSSSNGGTSGTASPASSVTSVTRRSPTGTPGSGISASGPVTSAS